MADLVLSAVAETQCCRDLLIVGPLDILHHHHLKRPNHCCLCADGLKAVADGVVAEERSEGLAAEILGAEQGADGLVAHCLVVEEGAHWGLDGLGHLGADGLVADVLEAHSLCCVLRTLMLSSAARP